MAHLGGRLVLVLEIEELIRVADDSDDYTAEVHPA